MVDKNILWDRYLHAWEGVINKWISTEEIRDSKINIPNSWEQLLTKQNGASVIKLWKSASDALPRFVSYISNNFLQARLAYGNAGYILVYYLSDWYETAIGEFDNGFMMAGLPATKGELNNYEQDIGKLPNSLKRLWLTHGFVQCRNETFFASIKPEQQDIVGRPEFYPKRKDNW